MCDAFGPPLFTRPFQKYKVYRKRSTILVFGIDKVHKEYSVLKIPAKDPHDVLILQEGEARFPLAGLEAHLNELRCSSGGLETVVQEDVSGLIGFIQFLQGYYLILITRHKKVGKIGHHYVLSIEKTQLVPLFAETTKNARDEKMLKEQFNALNLAKDFYFSYSYELSRTLQQNLADAARSAKGERRGPLLTETDASCQHPFVWNHFHMQPLLKKEGWQHWCVGIIHGFFAYALCSSFGWTFEIALIARRSRFFAGTRYRKRGLDVDGHVGNDVETEQLLCDDSTRHLSHGHVMSFVQVRGSVPLFWSQEATAINPKPPIQYHRCDPTLSATRLHFADLLTRYGTPQLVVNLMKAKKVDSYEVRLSKHFESAIERMNRELPVDIRILYKSFDMKNHAKSSPIYEVFARLSQSVVDRCGFFHSSRGLLGKPECVQTGVVRTNCVDCLDRTNVLQFFVGLEVLKQQLTALNLLPEPRLDFDSQVVAVLSELYDLMGDHLALQYAGSVAHKKYQLLGSRPRMMTSSKELLTSIHRHYNNSFTDSEKQYSLNLFLGIYQPREHPRVWELDSDSWVHHRPLRDDYDPGEWWKHPLETYSKNMSVLDCINTPLALSSPEGQQAWFREVHTVWQLTWFEKLLSSLEETAVQINRPNRKLCTLRPYKAIKDQLALQGDKERARTQSFLADGPFEVPRPVDESDQIVYKSFTDMRRLGQYIWASRQSDSDYSRMNLSPAPFTMVRPESPARSLMDAFQAYNWRDAHGARPGCDKDESLFMSWFACKHLGHLLHRDRSKAQTSANKNPRSMLTAHFTAERQSEIAKRFQVQKTKRESPGLPSRLRRCAYCDEAYDAVKEPCFPTSVSSVGSNALESSSHLDASRVMTSLSDAWNPGLHLCERHRARLSEMQQFSKQRHLDVQPNGEAESDRGGSRIVVNVSPTKRGPKPWKGWVKVSKVKTDSPSAKSQSQCFQRRMSQTPERQAAPTAAVASSPGSIVDSLVGDSHRRGSDLSEAHAAERSPCSPKPLGAKNDDQWRHLWSYAFPYMEPPAPTIAELGLPHWWQPSPEPPAMSPRPSEPLKLTSNTSSGSTRSHVRRKSGSGAVPRQAGGFSSASPSPPTNENRRSSTLTVSTATKPPSASSSSSMRPDEDGRRRSNQAGDNLPMSAASLSERRQAMVGRLFTSSDKRRSPGSPADGGLRGSGCSIFHGANLQQVLEEVAREEVHEDVQVGDEVVLTSDADELKDSFNGTAYKWHPAMNNLLGRILRVLQVENAGTILRLDEAHQNTGDDEWFHARSIVKRVLKAPRCSTPGCGRVTWNGHSRSCSTGMAWSSGERCCGSCAQSDGKEHDATCREKFKGSVKASKVTNDEMKSEAADLHRMASPDLDYLWRQRSC